MKKKTKKKLGLPKVISYNRPYISVQINGEEIGVCHNYKINMTRGGNYIDIDVMSIYDIHWEKLQQKKYGWLPISFVIKRVGVDGSDCSSSKSFAFNIMSYDQIFVEDGFSAFKNVKLSIGEIWS